MDEPDFPDDAVDAQLAQWGNFKRLEQDRRGNQWGSTAFVLSTLQADPDAVPPDVSVKGAQVIKWSSDYWNPNAWRVYLGPWEAKEGMDVPVEVFDVIVPDLAFPSLDGIGGQGQLAIPKGLSFVGELQCFARVRWGTFGVDHVAYVDWPVRGLLLQVSGSYVEVNAVAVLVADIDDDDPPTAADLPNLGATLSNEPGGGDASAAGTLTYRFQSGDWAGGQTGINFNVPPFARSIRFIWDMTKDNASPDYATSAEISFRRPRESLEDGVYVWTWTAGDIGDPREPLAVPSTTAYVRVEFSWTDVDPPDRVAAVGVIFELDL